LVAAAARADERGKIEAEMRRYAAKYNKKIKKLRSKAAKRDVYAKGKRLGGSYGSK
jgi:hypothetical protein